MSTLCLIDAHSLCYRAFYAIKTGLATSYGQPTNAVYGFISMLNRILKELKPEYAAMCFDVGKPTFRKEKFKDYKIQRKPMPDDLKTQIPLIKDVVSAYNLKIVEKEGFEADDVIAAFTHRAKKRGLKVVVVTSDKDMLQLVNGDVKVYNPYKGEGMYFGAKEVEEQFGVKPENIIDLLSLTGDSVDNVPGVKGIGEKTARNLIQEFHNIDFLLKNIKKIKSEKVRGLISEHKDELNLSRELIRLPVDFQIDFELKDLKLRDVDYEELYKLFSKLEFKSLLKSLNDKVANKDFGQDLDFIKDIKQNSDIKQLDKELTKTKTFSFSFNAGDEKLRVGVYSGSDKLYTLEDKKEIEALFNNKTLEIIGNDIKSAKLFFHKHGVSVTAKLFDIMVAAYLFSSARSDYSISTLLYDYLKIGPLAKDNTLKNEAVFIYKLQQVFLGELEDKGLKDLFYKLEMPLVDVLFNIEKNGIKLDCSFLKQLSKNLDSRLNKLMQEIFKISKRQFNIKSPKQLREVLFNELKLPVVKKTKTGPSTDEEVLRKLSKQHELPSLILKYRHATKLKSTYVDVLPGLCDKKTNRVHSNFLQTGTETGRLSSNNPNLQNIPIKTELGREIRRAFVSGSANWSLLSCDYSQIELRILAHLSRDEVLIEAFERNSDVHKATAALIYQVDIADVEDKMREVAKRVNFGVIYGMSSYGLSKDLEISVPEAQNFIDTYFLRYPKVNEYINSQIEFARSNGYISTIMGRRRYFPYINSRNIGLRQFSERQAVNASIQGSAADLIKLAMIDIQLELNKREMQAKMVLQVHDELVFDFPKREESDLIGIVKKGMEEAIKLDVPIKASLKIGQNWADMQEIG
ncbi:DNA polymerase I [Candidatus Omnitrophota bacterium]